MEMAGRLEYERVGVLIGDRLLCSSTSVRRKTSSLAGIGRGTEWLVQGGRSTGGALHSQRPL